MLNEEALELFANGRVSTWNQYRKSNPEWRPDLSGLKIIGLLPEIDFSEVNLCGTDLSEAHLCGKDVKWEDASSSRAILKNATYDLKTKFPPTLDPGNAGAIFVSKANLHARDASRAKIFISYAWANDDVVLAVDTWLRKKGLQTRLDKRDFFAGSRIRDEIMRVMQECDIILVFHSKMSATKPWPEFERELANDLEMEAKKDGREPPRIIYVVIDDTPLPSVSEKNKIAVVAKGIWGTLFLTMLFVYALVSPPDLSPA